MVSPSHNVSSATPPLPSASDAGSATKKTRSKMQQTAASSPTRAVDNFLDTLIFNQQPTMPKSSSSRSLSRSKHKSKGSAPAKSPKTPKRRLKAAPVPAAAAAVPKSKREDSDSDDSLPPLSPVSFSTEENKKQPLSVHLQMMNEASQAAGPKSLPDRGRSKQEDRWQASPRVPKERGIQRTPSFSRKGSKKNMTEESRREFLKKTQSLSDIKNKFQRDESERSEDTEIAESAVLFHTTNGKTKKKTFGEKSPSSDGRKSPTVGRYASSDGRKSPTVGRYASSDGRRSPTVGRYDEDRDSTKDKRRQRSRSRKHKDGKHPTTPRQSSRRQLMEKRRSMSDFAKGSAPLDANDLASRASARPASKRSNSHGRLATRKRSPKPPTKAAKEDLRNKSSHSTKERKQRSLSRKRRDGDSKKESVSDDGEKKKSSLDRDSSFHKSSSHSKRTKSASRKHRSKDSASEKTPSRSRRKLKPRETSGKVGKLELAMSKSKSMSNVFANQRKPREPSPDAPKRFMSLDLRNKAPGKSKAMTPIPPRRRDSGEPSMEGGARPSLLQGDARWMSVPRNMGSSVELDTEEEAEEVKIRKENSGPDRSLRNVGLTFSALPSARSMSSGEEHPDFTGSNVEFRDGDQTVCSEITDAFATTTESINFFESDRRSQAPGLDKIFENADDDYTWGALTHSGGAHEVAPKEEKEVEAEESVVTPANNPAPPSSDPPGLTPTRGLGLNWLKKKLKR